MEVKLPPTMRALIVQARDLPKLLSDWQVGQTLRAVAQSDSADGQVTLNIDNRLLTAAAPQPLRAGQILELRIESLGRQPVLQVLEQIPPTSSAAQSALRSLLPLQRPLGELMANIAMLAGSGQGGRAATAAVPGAAATAAEAAETAAVAATANPTAPATGGTTESRLPPPLADLTARFFAALADSETIRDPAQLKQALERSGNFLEAKLAQAVREQRAPDTANDLKALLLQLFEALRSNLPPGGGSADGERSFADLGEELKAAATRLLNQPPLRGGAPEAQARAAANLHLLDNLRTIQSLLKQTEGALARTQLHQLASRPAEHDGNRQIWLFELPIRQQQQVDILHLRIEREREEQSGSGGKAGEHAWSVMLAFNFDELGPVHAKVSLQGEAVSTTFWAEQADTEHRFRDALDLLWRNLVGAGLKVESLTTHVGRPPASRGIPERLLDEKV